MGDFLTLSEAAERLNVHPTTLRRWADQGDILVMVTPGGHRRFPVSEIERLRQGGSEGINDSIELIIESVLNNTREELKDKKKSQWVKSLDEEERNRKRETGREIMSLLSSFIKSEGDDEETLSKASEIGAQYGHDARESGMSISSVVSATMFFRDKIIEAFSASEERNGLVEALRRTHHFLNTLLISATEAFERDPAS